MTPWLFTIEVFNGDPYRVGEPYRLWSLPPRWVRSGSLRLRLDGLPYHPAWEPGDEITIFHPEVDRCVAFLGATSLPRWKARAERFDMDTVVLAADPKGPRLSDLGIHVALQGGRHRISPDAHRRAREHFGLGRALC
jgi:hypothetical protein